MRGLSECQSLSQLDSIIVCSNLPGGVTSFSTGVAVTLGEVPILTEGLCTCDPSGFTGDTIDGLMAVCVGGLPGVADNVTGG